jgi:predicted nuclease of predicted toxin-antitoxin system
MRVKVDEDLPKAALLIIENHGHDATSVMAQDMGGWKDPALWRAIQVEERFLVTADKGFADIRIYPPGTHAGILLLRPDQSGIRPLVELLQRVLVTCDLESLAGSVVVATPQGIRVRRAR